MVSSVPDDPLENARPRGLYPLIDADACEARELDLLECARAILDAGPPILQLRAKGRPTGLVVNWAEAIASQLSFGGPRFIVNDRADIATSVGANGVHVGQEDLPARELVRAFPKLAVGLSTHDERQLDEALEISGLDYVAFGPVFPTLSKKNAEPSLSLQRLEGAFRRTRAHRPALVAIGGITESNLADVSRASDLVAAVSMVLPDTRRPGAYSWIRERCASLNRKIQAEGRI